MASESPGQTLRRLRKAAGLSQVNIALKAGFSQSTVHNWEVGDSWPAPSHWEKLAAALGVRPQDLADSELQQNSLTQDILPEDRDGELDQPAPGHRRLYVDIGPEVRAAIRARARRHGRSAEDEAVFLLDEFFHRRGTLAASTSPQKSKSLLRFGALILDLPVPLVNLLARMAEQEYRTVSGTAAVVLGAVLQNGQPVKRAPTKTAKPRGRPRKAM
jgi:transcriptional regulator with XRE-family HTH domain